MKDKIATAVSEKSKVETELKVRRLGLLCLGVPRRFDDTLQQGVATGSIGGVIGVEDGPDFCGQGGGICRGRFLDGALGLLLAALQM